MLVNAFLFLLYRGYTEKADVEAWPVTQPVRPDAVDTALV